MANQVPLVIADFETQLSGAISAGATSFTLASATDDDGNALAAGKYCFTINNGASNKQYLLGQLNGTAVTSVVRVDRRGNETSGAQYAARSGSPVMITNFATLQRVADILRGQETLDGDNPVSYDAEPSLSDRKELATVAYVLDNVNGGTVNFDNQIVSSSDATAGETISAGNLVFFQESDQEWYQVDADTAAEVDNVQLGIALGSGTDGVSITSGVQISGVYTTSGLTAGDRYYAGNTPGAISNSAGTTERMVGVALSSTKLLLNFSEARLPTADQKDAMAGSSGTPSTSNTFVTTDDVANDGTSAKIIRANGTDLPSGITGVNRRVATGTVAWVTNTTTETNLLSESIAGGTLGTEDAIRVTAFAEIYDSDGSLTTTFRLKYGSTTICSVAPAVAATAQGTNFKIEALIVGNGGTSAQQGFLTVSGEDDITHGDGTATEDSTGALNLVITAQHNNAANVQLTGARYLIEKIQ